MNNEYNYRHYWQHFDHEFVEENKVKEEKSHNAWIRKHYDECKLDQNFCNNYEEWLEKEFWDYYD